MVFRLVNSLYLRLRAGIRGFVGSDVAVSSATRWARIGLGVSGGFLTLAGLVVLFLEPFTTWALATAFGLLAFGLVNIISVLAKKLTLVRANKLSLIGYLIAVVALYAILSRSLFVTYTTDTIVGTYLGVLKAAQFQSPYAFSIKPLMDFFGFSTSYYTPGVNGTFDFHLAYPSLSFLSLLPLYVAGLHDLRDGVFLFYLVSLLIIFGLAPSRLKSISLAPFGLFPFVIASSWTDSVWAFFLVLTALLWYRHPKASWLSFGLAVATKQVAIVVAPFLLIRLWNERTGSRPRVIGGAIGLMAAAFFLPNLPFIIASPGAWWSDVVAPYLPNTASQVPGGIGLSNILLDLGVALPASFFLVTMLGVTSLLLYAYARHYRGLNSLVFGFPILMFFFYYRSFPNYMAYWVFPLVLDFCRLGGPNLRLLLSIRMPRISWRPTTSSFVATFRRRLTPSLVILIVLTTAFAGVSGAYLSQAASPRAQIQINSAADPDSIGAATLMNVTLKNLETTPVLPNFFVKFSPLPYFWTKNSSATLASGSEQSYVINAPDAYSAIPSGDTFHVLVYDNLTNQLLGESSASRAILPTPRVANPGLRWWALDQSLGRRVPWDWRLAMPNVDPTTSGIDPLGVNGTSGLAFTLNYTSPAGALERLTLSQRLLFNSTTVQLGLNQSLTTDLATKTMLFASITDGTHTVYYVFSSEATQQSVSQYSANSTVIVPVRVSQWTNVTLDPQSVWNSQSWGVPQQVTLTVTIQATASGVYYASLDEIIFEDFHRNP
jgi:uncharacterized membrane protein